MADFQSNLNAILGRINEAKQETLVKIGEFVEGQSKLDCPVDTGNLRNSLTNKVHNESDYVEIGSNVEYAKYVHNGTRRMRARPFITDAAEQNLSQLENIGNRIFAAKLGR